MCIEFFSDNSENKEKCKLLQKMSQDILLSWERESASKYSPSPVRDEEILCRQIFSPTHYDEETQEFTSTAFDDASSIGMSVNRLDYTSVDNVAQAANGRVTTHNESNLKQRSFPGIIKLNCDDIRKITVQDEGSNPIRGYCIYDTALEHDESHADICQIVKTKSQHGRSIRLKIRDIANLYLKNNPF